MLNCWTPKIRSKNQTRETETRKPNSALPGLDRWWLCCVGGVLGTFKVVKGLDKRILLTTEAKDGVIGGQEKAGTKIRDD